MPTRATLTFDVLLRDIPDVGLLIGKACFAKVEIVYQLPKSGLTCNKKYHWSVHSSAQPLRHLLKLRSNFRLIHYLLKLPEVRSFLKALRNEGVGYIISYLPAHLPVGDGETWAPY